jgi:hypothetical protein
MGMNLVRLEFQTPQDFQNFRKTVADNVQEISISNLSIICDCTMNDIEKAINQFGATVKDAPGRPDESK